MTKTVIAAAIGDCVHVAGVTRFLALAESAGWKTIFLGPATSVQEVLHMAKQHNADLVGVSYRLTPENGERLLAKFAEEASMLKENGVKFAFAGTPPVAKRASAIGFFDQVFDGTESPDEVISFLKGQQTDGAAEIQYPRSVIDRIHWKAPIPILRHHFGLPSIKDTIDGVKKIADSGCLDVISLGTDQDAQENFFRPERQKLESKGAGGVPVRTPKDFEDIFQASLSGNYPLLRSYSGTDDFIRYAEILTQTIHNAWCAIPLFWFNQMDGRGPWGLKDSIDKHQQVMRWYGERGIPVELNEPHHWGMRDASDVVFVVAAFLSAYNARHYGVKDYIAQFMFNSPPGHSDVMDMAKMVAILELIEPLQNSSFHIWRQTRIGLLSHPVDQISARGHLAASTYMQMSLKPHIYHVVGHTEAHHAATADDVIEACKIARAAIQNGQGAPSPLGDERLIARSQQIISEAQVTLAAIRQLANTAVSDPWVDPQTLEKAVTFGILDAPQLANNPFAKGHDKTRIIDGASLSVNDKGQPISEEQRIGNLAKAIGRK